MSNNLGKKIESWMYYFSLVHSPGGDDGVGGF